jgi:ABC-type Mn2+/Zn2+ transport system permease subunit
MHATGALFAFASLVLPALAARELCRTMAAMLWAAPLLGASVTFVALFAAHTADLPPGQVAAALLGAVLLMAWLLRTTRPR